ncbi:GGDEF domain-containing protein [Alkalihalobacillus deserti]|uniref:GGDEF domain-containing protein n=1 Tax=Alkalihalobacillus deserti TaxID=2879466 RepID=UPI001D15BC2A|nr:GGDEF domain-containing protein [Alkalihalobacillus deserti]
MKEVKIKIYIAFISLFFLMLFLSCFLLFNAYQTYKDNHELHAQSIEMAETILRLEYSTSRLNFLGQQHILSKRNKEMNDYNKEIESTFDELMVILMKVELNIENDSVYSNIIEKWELYWSIFEAAISLSQENNDTEALRLLIEANREFEEFKTFYLQPLSNDYYQLIFKLIETQKTNYISYLWFGVLLLVISILGFVLTFYYLQQVLKETVSLKQKLEFLAFHDELTKLPNRRMFQKQVTERISESDERFAFMYLDMDKFKSINDNFGHDIGDLVIVEFSKRVKNCIRDTDMLSRQGGDEFTILLNETQEEKIIGVADRIIRSFEHPLFIEGKPFHMSTSIGIAIYLQNGNDYPTLLKNADNALYEAKKHRNIFKISKQFER